MARCKGWKSLCGTPCIGNYPPSMVPPGTTILRCRSLAVAKTLLRDAKATIAQRKKPVIPPRVVAELSFGFWVSLLGPGPSGLYEMRLWCPILYKAFPKREAVAEGSAPTPSTACAPCAIALPITSPFFSGILRTITEVSSRCWRGYARRRPPRSGITAPSRLPSRDGHDVPPFAKRIRSYGVAGRAVI